MQRIESAAMHNENNTDIQSNIAECDDTFSSDPINRKIWITSCKQNLTSVSKMTTFTKDIWNKLANITLNNMASATYFLVARRCIKLYKPLFRHTAILR